MLSGRSGVCGTSLVTLVAPTKYQIYWKVKGNGLGVQTKTSYFAETVVSLCKKPFLASQLRHTDPEKRGMPIG